MAASLQVRTQIEAAWQRQDQENHAVIDATNALHWRHWYGLDDDADEPEAVDLPTA